MRRLTVRVRCRAACVFAVGGSAPSLFVLRICHPLADAKVSPRGWKNWIFDLLLALRSCLVCVIRTVPWFIWTLAMEDGVHQVITHTRPIAHWCNLNEFHYYTAETDDRRVTLESYTQPCYMETCTSVCIQCQRQKLSRVLKYLSHSVLFYLSFISQTVFIYIWYDPRNIQPN